MRSVSSGDGLRRSARLLNAFRVEQTNPDHFYGVMAADAVRLVTTHTPLRGRTMIDVGAGPPQFADAFCAAGARYVAVDADAASIRRPLPTGACAVVADGERLPLPSTSVDVCFSSNVLEHVRAPLALADELVRVTKPGGWIFLSYTNWLSPWGGHETSPFHYLGGRRAARIYTRRYGHQPKNRIGCNLFKISISTGLRWAVANGAVEVVDARPRYLPTWSRTLLRVPGLRELLTWNLLLVLRRQ